MNNIIKEVNGTVRKNNTLKNSITRSKKTRNQDKGKNLDYMCNICYLCPSNPVLTQCGHLFCWECIYCWSNSTSARQFCPTCRNEMVLDEVISVHVDGSDNKNNKIPLRPANNRPVKVIVSGTRMNGTRFGDITILDETVEALSYRTVIGLVFFGCLVMFPAIKSFFTDVASNILFSERSDL